MFGGIIQLMACTAQDITQFYFKHGLDMQRMVMLAFDGASVTPGKHNSFIETEQHCVAHREDLGIDNAWKNVTLTRDMEALFTTVYTFSRSAVKSGKMEDLAKPVDEDVTVSKSQRRPHQLMAEILVILVH